MKIVAFMSYAHSDERNSRGRITEIRERLEEEVRLLTGYGEDEFQVFWDKNDIDWGQSWRRRIDDTLDGTALLLPVVTPTFLKRPECRREVELFLDRESKLGRDDLIFPILFVGFEYGNEPTEDSLYNAIMSHQWIDWTEYRYEPISDPAARQTLDKMAQGICLVLQRKLQTQESGAMSSGTAAGGAPLPPGLGEPEDDSPLSETSGTPLFHRPNNGRETNPATLIVDPLNQGDHATIGGAIAAAEPGMRILVRPGLYEEGLVIDKPLSIIGDGSREEIVVSATGADAVIFKTTNGRIQNLTLRQNGGENGSWYGVDIGQGRLDLEGCDITSLSLSCVAVHSGAEPMIRRNRIHDSAQSGVFVYENGQGTFEENEIFGNGRTGVVVQEGGNPTFRRNRIHDGKQGGLFIQTNGQGTFEDNEIFGNGRSGVEVGVGGNPVFARNSIRLGKGSGLYIHSNGQGTFEENDIFDNALAGVEVKEGGNPTLRRNRIHKNPRAVAVHKKGRGVFIENDLTGNQLGAWDVDKDCLEYIRREGNQD